MRCPSCSLSNGATASFMRMVKLSTVPTSVVSHRSQRPAKHRSSQESGSGDVRKCPCMRVPLPQSLGPLTYTGRSRHSLPGLSSERIADQRWWVWRAARLRPTPTHPRPASRRASVIASATGFDLCAAPRSLLNYFASRQGTRIVRSFTRSATT